MDRLPSLGRHKEHMMIDEQQSEQEGPAGAFKQKITVSGFLLFHSSC
jgi:hypothetical protein